MRPVSTHNAGCLTGAQNVDRTLSIESVEGEIALVIDYRPGQSEALTVLSGAMRLIESLDALDHCLLSSIDTTLEPVSILNDVQHSSLKILLARALRKVPDEAIGSLDWKKWVGSLLVKGKFLLLQKLDADAPDVMRALDELKPIYQSAPGLVGFDPPRLVDVREAMDGVTQARATLGNHPVVFQSEIGDITLPFFPLMASDAALLETDTTLTNTGREYLKVKSPDMLGQSQWTVIRAGRAIKVDMLHRAWLDDYQSGKIELLPGDSLDCAFEESIAYDAGRNEIGRKLSVIEIYSVVRVPRQTPLF